MVAIVTTAILMYVFTGFEALLALVLIHELRAKHRPSRPSFFMLGPDESGRIISYRRVLFEMTRVFRFGFEEAPLRGRHAKWESRGGILAIERQLRYL
jgi:hypothetical protein